MSFPLLSLPYVVLDHLMTGGYLDSESKLLLGATCQALRSIVASQITSQAKWHSLLDGVHFDTLSTDVVQVKIYHVRSLTTSSVRRQQSFCAVKWKKRTIGDSRSSVGSLKGVTQKIVCER